MSETNADKKTEIVTTRLEVLERLDKVTEGVKRCGYLRPVAGRPHNIGTLVNYAMGMKLVEDPEEFQQSIRDWIEVMDRFIFDGIKNEELLRKIAEVEPNHEWISDFLWIKKSVK